MEETTRCQIGDHPLDFFDKSTICKQCGKIGCSVHLRNYCHCDRCWKSKSDAEKTAIISDYRASHKKEMALLVFEAVLMTILINIFFYKMFDLLNYPYSSFITIIFILMGFSMFMMIPKRFWNGYFIKIDIKKYILKDYIIVIIIYYMVFFNPETLLNSSIFFISILLVGVLLFFIIHQKEKLKPNEILFLMVLLAFSFLLLYFLIQIVF